MRNAIQLQVSNSQLYSEQSIICLLLQFLNNSDLDILAELLARHISISKGKILNIPQYILQLKESRTLSLSESQMILDYAYDITIAKFSNIPSKTGDGIDSRYYYRAFLDYVILKLEGKNVLQREIFTARKLRQFIDRHFKWSILDAKRKENGFVRSYTWKTGCSSYRINMPAVMTGRQCSDWLNDNIGVPDTDNAFEKERIQHIVNEQLFVPVKLSADADNFDLVSSKAPLPLCQVIDAELNRQSLADCIADEKADNLDSLRPTVAKIGSDNVRNLVKDIFEEINNDRYQPSLLAEKYNLSPASMTRFASIKWSRNSNSMPQLWQNLARYVVNSSKYSELLDQTRLSGKLLSMVKE